MAFQWHNSQISLELLRACQISEGDAAELKPIPASSELTSLKLRLSSESAEPGSGRLVIKHNSDEFLDQQLHHHLIWESSEHNVKAYVLGGILASETPGKSRFPWIFYDVCRFASHCWDQSDCYRGVSRTLEIELGAELAEMLIHLRQGNVQYITQAVACMLVYLHLARVPGCSRMEAKLASGEFGHGDVHLKVGESEWLTSRVLICDILGNPGPEFLEKLSECIEKGADSPVHLCVLFNEFDTCEWYLNSASPENQKLRLPNHDSSRLRIECKQSQITAQVTSFSFKHKDRYRETELLTADKLLKHKFRDDRFLKEIFGVCKDQATSRQKFSLDLYAVPCRTTLHLLRTVAEGAGSIFGPEDDAAESTLSHLDEHQVPDQSLHLAAARGDPADVARIAESNPSSVEHRLDSAPHRTPLLCAAAASVTGYSHGTESHKKCAEALLRKQANPEAVDDSRHTILHCAVLSCNLELVQYLLTAEAGANLLTRLDNSGKTPLMHAVDADHLTLARLLLERGADCDLQNEKGQTVMDVALSSKSLSMVKLLLEFDLKRFPGQKDRRFAEIYAAVWSTGSKKSCGLLLSAMFGMTEKDISEAIRLGALARSGKVAEVKQKLTKQNCNFRDWKLTTPLMWAAIGCWKRTESHLECIQILLSRGAEHSAVDLDGNTALHLAAAACDPEVLKLLMSAGALLDAKNFKDATALTVSQQRGQREAMEVLEQSVAPDPRASTEEALQLSKVQAQLLAIHDPTKRDEFATEAAKAAAKKGQLHLVQFLVLKLADQRLRDHCYKEAVKSAARAGQLEVVKFLVPTIADQTLRDKCCKKAAESAAWRGQLEVVKFLVPTIADQTLRDQCCKEAAKSAASWDQLEVVKFLVPTIADETLRDQCCKEAAKSASMKRDLRVPWLSYSSPMEPSSHLAPHATHGGGVAMEKQDEEMIRSIQENQTQLRKSTGKSEFQAASPRESERLTNNDAASSERTHLPTATEAVSDTKGSKASGTERSPELASVRSAETEQPQTQAERSSRKKHCRLM